MLSFGRAWRVRPKKVNTVKKAPVSDSTSLCQNMGNKQTVLSEDILEHYVVNCCVTLVKLKLWIFFFKISYFKTIRLTQDTTFLTKQEILRVLKRFCEAMRVCPTDGSLTYADLTSLTANYGEHLSKCPEIKVQQ